MKEAINTEKAPKAIGPYSQAVRANGFIFLSGQIPLDPDTHDVVEGNIVEQTRQVLKNIKSILEAAGAGLGDVVKTTVYLKDISRFNDMNKTYGEFFIAPFPARATIEVRNLPKDVDIEIDVVAISREE